MHRFDRRNGVFEVRKMSSGRVLVVDLARRRWDCGHFQVYVSDVYKISEICKVYRIEFVSLGDTEIWPNYPGLTMVANPALRRTSKGHPKSTHYLNEMDSRKMCGSWMSISQMTIVAVPPLLYPFVVYPTPVMALYSPKSVAMRVNWYGLCCQRGDRAYPY
ncbi:hypothetical protein AHAS_Ahas15G0141400 [Arachis hypogaea]